MNVHMEEISMDVIEELGNYSVDISKTIEEELSCIVPNNLQEASIYLLNLSIHFHLFMMISWMTMI